MRLTAERQALAAAGYPLACRLIAGHLAAYRHADPDAILSAAGWVTTRAAAAWSGRGDFRNYLTLRVLAELGRPRRRAGSIDRCPTASYPA